MFHFIKIALMIILAFVYFKTMQIRMHAAVEEGVKEAVSEFVKKRIDIANQQIDLLRRVDIANQRIDLLRTELEVTKASMNSLKNRVERLESK